MSGRIPDEIVSDVRERTNIVEVIGRHVQLKQSGINHKGLCPFHDEKTPSFNVNAAKQFFHCFGCQASGDVISFLMRIEGRRFREVVETLAQQTGVQIPQAEMSPGERRLQAKKRSERQRAIDLNARVARLYRHCLGTQLGASAREYLRQRGIPDQVVERFDLGFAPRGGNLVVRKLSEHGIDLEFASGMGLIAPRREGTGYHDRFWNRLIFPLHGSGGEVLGFGGRLIAEADGPKYINTPETSLYRKGQALYGLFSAAASIRKSGLVMIVEGNFDVLTMHAHGFEQAVAPMGTSLTESQVRLLKRFASQVIAIFDGDAAGSAAARKSVDVFLSAGLDARIAELPAGADPDSILVNRGAEALQHHIDRARPAVDYLIESLLADAPDRSIPTRSRIIEVAGRAIGKLSSDVAQSMYVDKLALGLGVDRAVVNRIVTGVRNGGRISRSQPAESYVNANRVEKINSREIDALRLLVAHPHLFARAENANLGKLLTNGHLRATYFAALAMQRESGEVGAAGLVQAAPTEVQDAVAKVLLSQDFSEDGDPTKALDDCVASLASARFDELIRLAKARIRAVEHGSSKERVAREAQMLQDILGLRAQFNAALAGREDQERWSIIQSLIEVERDIDET